MSPSFSVNQRTLPAAPALLLFGAVAAGVTFQTLFGFQGRFWAFAGVMGVALWALARQAGWRWAASLLLLLWAAGAGWLAHHQQAKEAEWMRDFPEGYAEWEARIVALPSAADVAPEWLARPADSGIWGGTPLVIVRPSQFGTPDAAALGNRRVDEVLGETRVGDLISIRGTLVQPNAAGNPGEFNFRAYQLRQGIVGTIFATSALWLDDKSSLGWFEQRKIAVQSTLQATRQWVRTLLLGHTPPRAGPVLLAMLTGDRTLIDPDVDTAFRRAGLSHLMAVSGVHVGLVASLTLLVTRLVGLRGWRSFFFVVPWIVFYIAFTGGKPSALRAGVMATGALAALAVGRRTSPLQFWALAGAGLLLYDPSLLWDVGFQLSFAASGTILLAVGAVRTMTLPGGWQERLRLAIRVNVAAQVGTLPLLAYHFNEISLAGWAVNFVAIPLAAPIVYGGVIGIVLELFPGPLGGWVLHATGSFLAWTLRGIETVGGLAWAAIEVPSPSAYLMAASALSVVGYALWHPMLSYRVRQAGVWMVLVAAGLVVGAGAVPLLAIWQQRVEIVFLDVGQGDAILIRTPRGRTVLIDAGGSPRDPEHPSDFFDVGLHRVLPYLRHRGIRHLDLIVNSHPHEDHLQGLVAILRHRQIAYALDAGAVVDTVTYHEYKELITEKQVVYRVATRNDVIWLEPNIYLEVLHPPDYETGLRGLNNNSLVLRLVTPHGSVLFTGDLERAGQQELLWGGEKQDLTARVIKVPHHGSGRDLERRWIDAVRPELAIVQVGRNNSFGHPADAVIRAYEERGATVLRTDLDGAITVQLTGRGLRVQSFR